MDFALVQLALIFMPGLIWANIDAKYGAGLKPSETALLIRAFLFGMTTYATLFIIYLWQGYSFAYPSLGSDREKLDLIQLRDEISWSIPLSFTLSILWLWAVRFRILMKLLHLIGATRRYGDEDVWSYTFNSDQAHVEYIHFRDVDNGYIFAGWVNTYSENEEYRELLLRDVIVYSDDGTRISCTPYLYISRPKSNIWIEFPYRSEGDKDVRQEADDQSSDQRR
ncbi:DUF6338 family protein [Paracoccus salipaludis]|uniref:DUF6338 family protein n=1 Tax=Paracoccus salipaludis TaxID=2032623 RepID=UPI001431CED9|nr:DUF6338 family protein [Paracoccus salipaludis]